MLRSRPRPWESVPGARGPAIIMAGPSLLGLALVLLLPRPGTWLDEAATTSATSRSWAEMNHLIEHQDRALSGYYTATWCLHRALHLAPLTAGRTISAVAFLAAITLVTLLGQRLAGRCAGLTAGVAMALLPASSSAAVNARPEALSIALLAGAFLLATRRRGGLGSASGASAVALVAVWVYALNVLYLPALLAMAWWRHGRLRRVDVVPVASACFVGGAWLIACSRQAAQVGWIHTSVGEDFLAAFLRVGFTAPVAPHAEGVPVVTSIVAAALTLVLALALMRRRVTRLPGLALLFSWAAPPLMATMAVAIGRDIFVARYFAPSTIAEALVLGCAVRFVGRGAARTVIPGIVLALCLPSVWASHQPDAHWGERLDAHTALVAATPRDDVWFVAPRNRAVLFAEGDLDSRWRNASWWADARRDGSLWGNIAPTPTRVGRLVIVTDTKRLSKLALPPGCHQHIVSQEARATVLLRTCD